jgi:hypothetical protein
MNCIQCTKPRVKDAPFFRLFFYLNTLGIKPRTQSKAETFPLCPDCAKKLTAAGLKSFVMGSASKKPNPKK